MDTILQIEKSVTTFLETKVGMPDSYSEYVYVIIALTVILAFGWLANFVVKKFLLGALRSLDQKQIQRLENTLEESFFLRLSHLLRLLLLVLHTVRVFPISCSCRTN